MNKQQQNSPESEMLPKEDVWQELGSLESVSGRLVACDLARLFSLRKADAFSLVPGRYELLARRTDSGAGCIAALRVAQNRQGVIRSRIRDIEVDSSRLAVFDSADLLRIKRQTAPEEQERFCEQLGETGAAGVQTIRNAPVVVVQPGPGDGCYPVFALAQAGTRIGLEIVFVGAEVLPVAEKSLIKRIRAAGSSDALRRLFNNRVRDLSGTGHPTMFDDLAGALCPQCAFSLIPCAAQLVLAQNDPARTLTAFGLLFNMVRSSDTTEIHPVLEARWRELASAAGRQENNGLTSEIWSDLCRWYRR